MTIDVNELVKRAAGAPNGEKILHECLNLASMLIEKNIAYGNSALNPVRIFARNLDPKAQILVRLDDKLSRLARGSAAGEDVILDLLGYLILYRIADAPPPPPPPPPLPFEEPTHPFDKIVVREPTPEEVEKLKAAAEEREKNSPYKPHKRGYVGIATSSASGNVWVINVDENSPAQKAGLLYGDLIKGINGVVPKNVDHISSIGQTLKPGDRVPFMIYREGSGMMTLTVELTDFDTPGKS